MIRMKYLWEAYFSNGVAICQPDDDRYSKHDTKLEHNPSSFRDFEEYYEEHPDQLVSFSLIENKRGGKVVAVVQLRTYYKGESHKLKKPVINVLMPDGEHWSVEEAPCEMFDAKPIYYREMVCKVVSGRVGRRECRAYVLGVEGKDKNGEQVSLERAVI